MDGAILVKVIEQLKPFINKDGVLEVAIRGKNQRFQKFIKIAINAADAEKSESISKLMNVGNILKNNLGVINSALGVSNLGVSGVNTAIGIKSLKMLKKLMNLQGVGLALDGLNLCATSAGFAVMYKKLEGLGYQVAEILGQLKTSEGVHTTFEFKKILSEHSDMLNGRRIQSYYSEEKMRQLVDGEYNVLDLLITVFLKDISDEKDTLIVSIYSLAAMLATSLKYFDEMFFYNNKDKISGDNKWHTSHDNWLAVFDRILSPEFVEKIQDYGFFDLNLNTVENDCYYKTLCEQIQQLKQSISDNQILVQAFENEEMFKLYNEMTNEEIRQQIIDAFEQSGISFTDDEFSKEYEEALEKVVSF